MTLEDLIADYQKRMYDSSTTTEGKELSDKLADACRNGVALPRWALVIRALAARIRMLEQAARKGEKAPAYLQDVQEKTQEGEDRLDSIKQSACGNMHKCPACGRNSVAWIKTGEGDATRFLFVCTLCGERGSEADYKSRQECTSMPSRHCDMTKYWQEMKVTVYEAGEYTRLLNEPDANIGRDEPVFDREVVFPDGYRVAIQVIASTEPDKEPCWSQGVLFDPLGHEIGSTDVGESLLGEFVLADANTGKEYGVIVATDMRDQYEGGECPDCWRAISPFCVDGDDCPECGHVFWAPWAPDKVDDAPNSDQPEKSQTQPETPTATTTHTSRTSRSTDHCPTCNEERVCGWALHHVEGNKMHLDRYCGACGAVWTEAVLLTGYTSIEGQLPTEGKDG